MEPIFFKDGLNVVYGDVEETESKDEHNLGKTSLVHLIDFLLLKGVTKDNLFGKFKNKFDGWVFYIELKMAPDRYLTIKRSVSQPNLVSFKEHVAPNQDFSNEEEWDYKGIKMQARKSDDAITILERYLNFDVIPGFSARFPLAYLLRTQYDYSDIFRMPEFRGADIEWKPALFELLGFDSKSVIEKYKIDSEIDILGEMVKRSHVSKSEDVFRLQAVISEKERELARVKGQRDKFDFYFSEKEINTELVQTIENKIGRLNSERYRLEYEIERATSSLQNNTVVDLDEIKSVFEEVKVYFPDNLRKNYEDLLSFNSQISKEREKYLKDELKDSTTQLETTSSQLRLLNKEKAEMLEILRETDTFQKYKLLEGEINKLEEHLVQLRQKNADLNAAEGYKKRIEALRDEAKKFSSLTEDSIKKGSPVFDNIRARFGDIFKEVMRGTAVLVSNINREGNPYFESVTFNTEESDEITGKGQGYTATKVQCAAFVISLLCEYSSKRFYKFAYHDGILEGWGDNPKLRFIQQVRELCSMYDIQFIFSIIKSDLPKTPLFKEGEKILTLDKAKPLFGFEF